jgi:DNA-binding CsgD family transcriptional regulator
MLRYLIYLIFLISVAMTALGIILSTKLRNKYNHEIFSTLLYFQVFIFTFGFYGIWGQVLIKAFLAPYLSAGLMSRFSDIAMLIGLPFLVFAWLMLIKFSCNISGRENMKRFVLWFLTFNFSIIIVIGYFVTKNIEAIPISMIRTYFILMSFVYTLISSILIFSPGKKPLIPDYNRKSIAIFLITIIILQCLLLILYRDQSIVALIFIMFFFAGNVFLPVYLNYGTVFKVITNEPVRDISLEEFCKRHEISPRETDIVREICNGLSNKEISEKLFISLQTVKDHTHRIYIKTNVRSRVQLINMVKETSL